MAQGFAFFIFRKPGVSQRGFSFRKFRKDFAMGRVCMPDKVRDSEAGQQLRPKRGEQSPAHGPGHWHGPRPRRVKPGRRTAAGRVRSVMQVKPGGGRGPLRRVSTRPMTRNLNLTKGVPAGLAVTGSATRERQVNRTCCPGGPSHKARAAVQLSITERFGPRNPIQRSKESLFAHMMAD